MVELDSTDTLLRKVAAAIAAAYQTECWIWINLEPEAPELIKVYGPTEDTPLQESSYDTAPAWLKQQCQYPQVILLSDGNLILPAWSSSHLRCVLQLHRADLSVHAWSPEEIAGLEIVCSQMILALDALYWRQRLEAARQQAALVGRIVRLLNSSLNSHEVMERIVAELGQGLKSARTLLINLREHPAPILAVWDQPDQPLRPLAQFQIERGLWLNVIEMFLQGSVSYLEMSQGNTDPMGCWLQAMGATHALAMPLSVQQEFFGVILLLSSQADRTYSLDELRTIQQVADQAAIALSNAEHYQTLWSRQETLRRQNTTLQLEVIHDPLTQLLNRRSLEQELAKLSTAIAAADPSTFSVIVLDLDHFKLINDTYGHLVGDEVLQIIAQRLENQLRGGLSSAYRYGGEEFIIILATVPLEKAMEVAERLRTTINSDLFRTTAGLLSITASFGVAQQHPNQDQNAWGVVHRADQALYEAKRQGRDRVVGF
ncbi:MAG: sensor domain-containing diguanylate cyclase [Leptolyngbyaceae bacterium]|nr:sensor domain-containing diguanylate cyclase [Leptolyngbyaceae bacterium]